MKRAGAIEVRPAEFVATGAGRRLDLTARELDLLTAFVERAGRIVSRRELYEAVWAMPYRESDRSVDVYVAKLRHKLAQAVPGVRFIHTHFGFGYRLEQEGGAPPRRISEPSSHRFHIPATSP